MNQLQLFLPCAAGVEGFLADEVHGITGLTGNDLLVGRGGVLLRSWRQALQLNLHSRLAQRVLVQLAHRMYRSKTTCTPWPATWPGRSGSPRARASRSRSRPSTARCRA
jgi:23S rRNA G2445 N2-methylase RlmL